MKLKNVKYMTIVILIYFLFNCQMIHQSDEHVEDNGSDYQDYYISYLYFSEGELSQTFNKNIFTYQLDIDVDSFKIKIREENCSEIKVVINNEIIEESLGYYRYDHLNSGENELKVILTSSFDDSTKEYLIRVNRIKSKLIIVHDIQVDKGTVDGNKIIIEYNTTELNITMDLSNNAKVKNYSFKDETTDVYNTQFEISSLELGYNKIELVLIAEDNITESSYKIYIYRDNENCVEWNKKIDNSGYDNLIDAKLDHNNSLYILMSTYSNGNESYRIKKFDENGNEDTIHWDKLIVPDSTNNKISCIGIDSSNNIFVGTNYDQNLVKYDSNGNLLNSITINLGEYTSIRYINIDNNDNVVIVGYYWDTDNNRFVFISKYPNDLSEDINNWSKLIDINTPSCNPKSVVIDSENNIYVLVTGKAADYYIKKFSTDGIEDYVNWNKYFEYNSSAWTVCFIEKDMNDNIYVVAGNNNVDDISKYDRNGILDPFYNDISINIQGNEHLNGLYVDENNNFYFAGSVNYEYATVLCFSKNLIEERTLWNKEYNYYNTYNSEALVILYSTNNRLYVIGETQNNDDALFINQYFLQ